MEHTNTKYKVLSVEKKNNEYNKYLKGVLKTVLVGLTDADDKKLIPLKDRQIHEEGFTTERGAKEKADFYEKNYKGGWGDCEGKTIKK